MIHFLRNMILAASVGIFTTMPVGAQSLAPSIDRIDPPDWWPALPAPMLLVHGTHLDGARFGVNGLGARVAVIRTSANGHWAFLQLTPVAGRTGDIVVSAVNAAGTARAPFRLLPRDASWSGPSGITSRDVTYLAMPDRFANGDRSNDHQPGFTTNRSNPHAWHGGDLAGAAEHVDYIRSLGATALWLTPIVENAQQGSYHGYGATDLYRVDPHYGTLSDAYKLSAALHRAGMKWVLDIVPNHVGPKHPWVTDEPDPMWFHGTADDHLSPSGQFESLLDSTAAAATRQHVLQGWFAGVLPDMNQSDPLVTRYFIQNTMWWIESTHADALRLDTFPYVDRTFWAQFHDQLHQVYPRLTTVGEVFNDAFKLPPALNAFFAGGSLEAADRGAVDTKLWTPFDYPFYSVVRDAVLHGRPMFDLSLLFSQDALYPHPERLVPLLGSHDTARIASDPAATPARLRIVLGLLYTVRGAPVLYSGDELMMPGGDDPDNRRDFPGGFGEGAFAQPSDAASAGMLTFVKAMGRLRLGQGPLITGDQQTVDVDQDVFAFTRGHSLEGGCKNGPRLLVIANKGAKAAAVDLNVNGTSLARCSAAERLIGDGSARLAGDKLIVQLPAESFTVFQLSA